MGLPPGPGQVREHPEPGLTFHRERKATQLVVSKGTGGKMGSSFGLQAHPGSGHRRETPAALVRKGGLSARLPELRDFEISL